MAKKMTTIEHLKKAMSQTKSLIAQVTGAAARDVSALQNGKQDKITGAMGQVVGFDASGNPVAQSTESLRGPAGTNGAAAGFGTPTATVDANVGTPSVTVTATGSNTAKVFSFAFKNLKGAKGDKGDTGKSSYQYAKEGGYTGTEDEFKALMGLAGTIAASLDEINGEVV